MSFVGVAVAAGVGLAAGVASSAIQAGAAGRAADALASGQRAAGDLYNAASLKSEQEARDAYQKALAGYGPYKSIGDQGTAKFATYLGLSPEYAVPAPEAPRTVASIMADWDKRNYGLDPAKRPVLRAAAKRKATASYAAQKSNYDAAIADWQAGLKRFNEENMSAPDRGEYLRQITQRDLISDPIYGTELDENIRSWDRSAASRGSLMSGNTLAGLREITAAGLDRSRGRILDDRTRKYNALAGLMNTGLTVQGVRSGLQTGLADTVAQNRRWATEGSAGAKVGEADARASGIINSGNAWANAVQNVGQLASLYGSGAFGGGGGAGASSYVPRARATSSGFYQTY